MTLKIKHSVYLVIFCFTAAFIFSSCAAEDIMPEWEWGDNENDGSNNKADDSLFFKDEVRPDKSRPCFAGAYYRKIVSSKDVWLGISGEIILPKLHFDPDRTNPDKPGQYLDNPSIYMGGNMNSQETDVGLTWEVIKDEIGNVSKERKAFRPFFRRSSYAEQEAIWISAPAEPKYYWYPEEEVIMSVQVVSAGKVKFTVKGAGKEYEAIFDCAGCKPGAIGDFKRVNAIDQVGNEGKSAQPTKTRVLNAVWKETNLYRKHEGKVISVPFSSKRFTDMRCPDTKYFQITSTPEDKEIGAEVININGNGF